MSYNNNAPTSPGSRPPSSGGFLSLPEMSNPKEQTLLWQQNSYMSDSGIQSGESTHAPPTLCGKEDDLEDPMGFDWDPSVFDQSFPEQVDDLNLQLTGPQFPDSLEQDIEVPQFDLPHPTAGQQVAEPAQVPDTFNLDNLQDDVDLATRLIPSLVSYLQDADDQVVVSQATEVVRQLLHREVSQVAMVRCAPQVAGAMVRVAGWSGCLDTVKGAAKVLFFLSHHPEGHQAIYAAGGVPVLIKALASPMDSILFCAISTLHNLLLHQEGAKAAVCAAGGLQMLVSLLKRNNNVKFLTIVMDCLKILAIGNQNNKVWEGGLQMVVSLLKINNPKLLTIIMECLKTLAIGNQNNKLIIFQSGGSAELVRIMQSFNVMATTEKSVKVVVEKLLLTTSSLIKVLAVCARNKKAIVEVGGMQALAMHLGTNSQRLVLNCLWALRNLSDAATCESNIEGLLQGLVQLMGSSDVQVVTCSAGILSNMTCNNQHNKVAVCRAGGVDALVRALMQAGGREEITEPAVCALRHLMSRHPEVEFAQNTVRLSYGIQVIVKLLHPPSSLPLIKAVIGLIRNLALCPANSALLREHGAIPRLVQLLIDGYHASVQGGLSSGVEDVRMEKILEGVLSAFQMLARDPHNRALIHKFNVLPLLQQLLGCNVECVSSMAEKVLWAFAAEDSGPPSGISTPPLMEMLSPPPPMDRPESCAAGSLFRMPENKADDKKQFSIEPATSIFTDDSGLWSGLSSDIDMNLLGSEEAYPGTDIHMMGPEETFNDPMYQGPPHPGYEPQEFDPLQGYEADFKWFEKKN